MRTERLDVRHLVEGNVDAMLAAWGDRDATEYVGDGEVFGARCVDPCGQPS